MYGMTLRQYIQKCPKSFLVTETGDIKTYLALMMTSGCSKTYCNIHRRVLSSFFVWLFNEGMVPRNPMRGIKKIKQPKILEEAFSYADMEKIREHCIDVRERAIVEVLLSTGCRAGELVGATLSNLHLSEGTLKVYGKGQKERIVYLNAAAKLWLGKYLKERNDEEECLFAAKQRQNGKAVALRTAGLGILIRKLGRRAGVNNCHPHRFRRTAATWAARRGMRVEQVQQMLGHEQIETTMIYVSVAQKDVQIAHERYLGGD